MAKKKIIRKTNKTLNLFWDGGGLKPLPSIQQPLVQSNQSINLLNQLPEGYSRSPKGSGLKNLGNKITADKIAAVGQGIGSILNIAKDNASLKDTSGIENTIKAANAKEINADSNDALMAEWNAFNPQQQLKMSDVTDMNFGKYLSNNISAVTSGASAGSSVGGPMGALIGGIVGHVSSDIGALVGRVKAKKKLKELNENIDYSNRLFERKMDSAIGNVDTQNDLNLLANYAAYGGYLPFASGGQIHIKKANRGKFTEAAKRAGMGVQEYARHILANKKKYSPTLVKRANFARNAAGWKHDMGGNLFSNGGEFTNGVTMIDNGGSHEENPMEGVPMGIAPDGTPNLVEQGEVKFNDYIFSNRLFLTKKLLEQYNLPLSYTDYSFAAAAEKLSKESEERPNDPISKRGLTDAMSKLQQAQEQLRSKQEKENQYAYGGKIGRIYEGTGPYSNFLQFYTPAENWLRRLREADNSPFKLPDYKFQRRYYKDRITSTEPTDLKFPSLYENIKPASFISSTTKSAKNNTDSIEGGNKNRDLSWLRYAPAVGSGINVLTDTFGVTNEPNYDNVEMIGNIANNLSEINSNPIGNYLTYKPFDRNYYLNKLNAQSSAIRRAITEQAGGNRINAMAGLLAADYNALNSMGDLARQAEEYNQAQKERVETFNRGTNQFNSEMALKAAIANKENEKLKLESAIQQAQMKENIDARSSAARSANLTNFFDNLGNIGIDTENKKSLKMLIKSGALGDYSYEDLIDAGFSKKEAIEQLRKQGWTDKDLKRRGIIEAYGGRINTRKKRGLTF